MTALHPFSEYFSAVHRASEDSPCVSRGIILTTFGSANFGLFAGIWGIYGARLRYEISIQQLNYRKTFSCFDDSM